MKQIGSFGALALCALLAGTVQARQAQVPVQVQSPQQAQQAQQARQQAEAYLRKEEAATTVRRSQSTDRANQDAAVPDEAASHSDAARPARSTSPPTGASGTSGASGSTGAGPGNTPPPSYGPVLNPRQPQSADPARKDPAEVHDETDSLTREAPPQQQPQKSQQDRPKQQKQAKQTQRRREAWQPAGPLAPRSLNSGDAPAIGYGALIIPAPAQAPQPVVPSTTPLQSCVGGACRDTAGGSYNLGPTGTGVSSSGRLCSSNGTTVQCF
jgi:hypothetical protein